MKKQLLDIKGFSEIKVERVKEAARKMVVSTIFKRVLVSLTVADHF